MEYLSSIKLEGVGKFEKILNEKSYYDKEDVKNAADLIKNMLKWDGNKRYSAEQCLSHLFFKEKENTIQ